MNENIRKDMENISPPEVVQGKKDASPASASEIVSLNKSITETKSIAGAASKYNGQCDGGDTYANNCAHYLSNAFINAGYSELLTPNDCVTAGCGTSAKRVIRARDMWCWFKEMALESRTSIPTNDGCWAVFQLDESAYWGGHVLIIDTDTNTYYGTGNYPSWDQYAYKW